MLRMTEENGACRAVLRQASFFPIEGLSDEAFLKVLIPSQQAAGRKLLREGYLTRTKDGGIALSPLMKNNCPPQMAWDENIRSFLLRLITSLAESVVIFRKAEKWAESVKGDPETLRMLVFQLSRDNNLPSFQKHLAEEALSLVLHDTVPRILPEANRTFLVNVTIGIEKAKNLGLLRKQTSLIVPTLENVLNQLDCIPAQYLLRAYDCLSDLFIILEDDRSNTYIDKWRLLVAASSPAFETVEAGLGALYHPKEGNETVGTMLKRWKEKTYEKNSD
ncbi:MAG: hypothetical protein IKM73_08110 [Acidaminococcaceae bacterium]|nr:hypothetical protein [Acidaminococcaceae bacterium]